jgi:HlyD family secretion protein
MCNPSHCHTIKSFNKKDIINTLLNIIFGFIVFYGISALLMLMLSSCSSNNIKSDAYGNFEADETIISSEIAGKILAMPIDEGMTLKEGSLIAQIDTIQLTLKREQLLASISAIGAKTQNVDVQLNVYEKRLENLLREKNRIERLLRDSAATQKQYDDISGELTVVERQIDAARSSLLTSNEGLLSERKPLWAQIFQIEDQLKKCRIISPLNATILAKYANLGEIATPGKALAKIADLSKMYLRVYVSGAQLQSVKLGGKAELIIDAGNGKTDKLEGTVVWISDKAEFTPKVVQTRDERVNLVYAVKIETQNTEGRIKIGMPGEANFK